MATGLLHYLTTVDTPKAVADDGLENDFAHRVDEFPRNTTALYNLQVRIRIMCLASDYC